MSFCLDLLGYHLGSLYGVSVSDNLDSLLRVLKIIQVDPDHIIPVLCTAVGLRCFFVPSVCLLRLGVLDVYLWGCDVGEKVSNLCPKSGQSMVILYLHILYDIVRTNNLHSIYINSKNHIGMLNSYMYQLIS